MKELLAVSQSWRVWPRWETLSWGRGLGFGVEDWRGRLVSAFLRPCGKESGDFTELGEESWPVGGLEVVIFFFLEIGGV